MYSVQVYRFPSLFLEHIVRRDDGDCTYPCVVFAAARVLG